MADLRQLLGMDTNVRQIASLLKAKAPAGEHLAYINDEEAQLLRNHGGSGRLHENTGIPSYSIGGGGYDTGYDYGSDGGGFQGFDGGQNYNFSGGNENVGGFDAGQTYDFGVGNPSPSFQPNTPDFSNIQPQITPPTIDNPYGGITPTLGMQGSFYGGVGEGRQQVPEMSLDNRAPISPTTPQDLSFLQRTLNAGSQGIDRLTQGIPNAIGNLPEALVRSIPQLLQARQQGKAVQRAAQETQKNVVEPIKQIGQPYTQRGQAGLARAEQGGLTPGQMQQINAAQARTAQGSERLGGVGAQQAQNRLVEMQANLVQQNYQNALQEMAMGDKYLMAAIQAGVLSNKDVAAQTQKLMSNLFYNMFPGTQPVQG